MGSDQPRGWLSAPWVPMGGYQPRGCPGPATRVNRTLPGYDCTQHWLIPLTTLALVPVSLARASPAPRDPGAMGGTPLPPSLFKQRRPHQGGQFPGKMLTAGCLSVRGIPARTRARVYTPAHTDRTSEPMEPMEPMVTRALNMELLGPHLETPKDFENSEIKLENFVLAFLREEESYV